MSLEDYFRVEPSVVAMPDFQACSMTRSDDWDKAFHAHYMSIPMLVLTCEERGNHVNGLAVSSNIVAGDSMIQYATERNSADVHRYLKALY